MIVQDPGHGYLLDQLDCEPNFVTGKKPKQSLIFVKREGPHYPGNVGYYEGTTSQEVLRALIDRSKYTNNQIHAIENVSALRYMRETIWHMEYRTARIRGTTEHMKYLAVINHIEDVPTCSECGHIFCLEHR